MGAIKGTIAVRRYAILDKLPEHFRQRAMKGVRAHAFLPLDPQSDLDASTGWVSITDNEQADLRDDIFQSSPNGLILRLTMRTDSLKPPPAEVKRQVKQRVAALEADQGRHLAKTERRAIQEEVVRAVKRKLIPKMRAVDVAWFIDLNRVYVWSHSKGANEAFVDLFTKSFGLRIDVEDASRWAMKVLDAEKAKKVTPTPELWQGFRGIRPLMVVAKEDDAD